MPLKGRTMTETIKLSDRLGKECDISDNGSRDAKDSSTASQHSIDDLPPLIGAPVDNNSSRYAAMESQHGILLNENTSNNVGVSPLITRANGLYESRQVSPSLRRRLKVLVRQKSEPDMLFGRDLGVSSPGRVRNFIAPNPPSLDSPRSQNGSDCNSPRLLRKPRSLHLAGSTGSLHSPRSLEGSPLILRRSLSITPHSPLSGPGEESPRHTRSQSFGYVGFEQHGSRPESPLLTASPAGPGSPFTARRGVVVRKPPGSRPETPGYSDILPAVIQQLHTQDHRKSFSKDEEHKRSNGSSVSMESVHHYLLEYMTPEERNAYLRSQQQQQQQQQHYNDFRRINENTVTDCSPPPANSPTFEVGLQDSHDNVKDNFTSSHSSGSERLKVDENSNDEANKRHSSSLYDIDEGRELAEEMQNVTPVPEQRHEGSRSKTNTCAGGGDDDVQNSRVKIHEMAEKKDEEEDKKEEGKSEEEEEDQDEEEDSYDENVPDYQKAPLSTSKRVKSWLAGLQKNSNNSSSSSIERFLPEIT